MIISRLSFLCNSSITDKIHSQLQTSHGNFSFFREYGIKVNKANLRDLIAATGLVILLKLDLNRRFFQPVWPWNLKDDPQNNKIIGHLFYVILSILHNFVAIGEFKLELTVRKRLIWV